MDKDDPLTVNCQSCGWVGKMLSMCEVCGAFISVTLARADEDGDGGDSLPPK